MADVRITNGDSEAYVPESAAAVYEANGWTVEDDGSSEEKPAAKKTAAKKTNEEG
jgi:hypothetical protein